MQIESVKDIPIGWLWGQGLGEGAVMGSIRSTIAYFKKQWKDIYKQKKHINKVGIYKKILNKQ